MGKRGRKRKTNLDELVNILEKDKLENNEQNTYEEKLYSGIGLEFEELIKMPSSELVNHINKLNYYDIKKILDRLVKVIDNYLQALEEFSYSDFDENILKDLTPEFERLIRSYQTLISMMKLLEPGLLNKNYDINEVLKTLFK